ncbi:MAG TPA: glycoside hydrolase family 30 beta sandwich domain-containing protein, partial [Vicinamibacterales bacterium]|nr:glycoside hydrolase family 30 beta sandwich domain-containing protein [Vicinamibacterales bacterium]
MLEWWGLGNTYQTLHEDLTVGRNSAWQKGVFFDSFGCQFGQTIGFTVGVNVMPYLCAETIVLRQYMKYVRPGAVRIGATSSTSSLEPVAFINADGRYVVVVKASSSGFFSVSGLPAGTYGVFYSTASQSAIQRPDVTISVGQVVTVLMPDSGVLTIHGATAGPSPSPPPPAPPPPSVPPPPPPLPQAVVVEFLGTPRDAVSFYRVFSDDGLPDGMFRLTFGGPVTITDVSASGPRGWGTTDANAWALGVAYTEVGPLLNGSGGSVNVSLPGAGSIYVFVAEDLGRGWFSAGQVYTFTVTTTSGTLTGTVTIGAPPPALPPLLSVDCVVSAWGPWSAWTRIDDTTEERTRTRSIVTPALNGGASCPSLIDTETRPLGTTPPSATLLAPDVYMSPSTCAVWVSITQAHAPAGDDWRGQVRRTGDVNVGSSFVTLPTWRSTTLSPGTYDFWIDWTKPDEPAQRSLTVTRTCSGN